MDNNPVMTVNPQGLKLNDNFTPSTGQTNRGLRDSTTVFNYIFPAGRQNLIPDAPNVLIPAGTNSTVSSIGFVQTNGLRDVISGSRYGPGSLLSTNVEAQNKVGISSNQFGQFKTNGNRSTLIDYRNTDPDLVVGLKQNPLSIYVRPQYKNDPVPAFFSFIKPDDFSSYRPVYESLSDEKNLKPIATIKNNYDKNQTAIANNFDYVMKTQIIDGSPNLNILGYAKSNPFLGISNAYVFNEPSFSGKTYGGDDSGIALPYAEQIYSQGNQDMFPNDSKVLYPPPIKKFEHFGSSNKFNVCKNKALVSNSPGFNAYQDNFIAWGESHIPDNLPWGPGIPNSNPLKQQGGIWPEEFPTSKPFKHGYIGLSNQKLTHDVKPIPRVYPNPYKDGLPGTLIA